MRSDQISQVRDMLKQGKDLSFIAGAIGVEIGDVQTVATSVTLGDSSYPHDTLLAFPFRYDTPGLRQGLPLLTPKLGDQLINAWLSVKTSWNGVTPRGDFGAFAPHGFMVDTALQTAAPFDLSQADRVNDGGDLSVPNASSFPSAYGTDVPFTVRTARPWVMVVSQDGTPTGADPGATQGEATFYLQMRRA